MNDVDESLRAMHAKSVHRPAWEPDEQVAAAFDELLRRSIGADPATPIDYTLAEPKWQFLCYAAENAGFVLHGSGNSDIVEFEPRQPIDTTEFGSQLAVYAASDALWAMYFAIVNRDGPVTTLYNGCYRLGSTESGPFGEPHYFFSINEDALDANPWRTGTVYLLPAESFVEQGTIQFDEHWIRSHQVASPRPVRPVAKITVGPEDFPLLADIHGHDTGWRITR